MFSDFRGVALTKNPHKNVAYGPHRSPEETVQIDKHISLYHNINKEKKNPLCSLWELMVNKLESHSPKDGLCQDWLKLAQWFLRKRFLYFHHFVIISPWKRVGHFSWTILNPHHPRMLCAEFVWNWFSCSEEEDEHVKSLRRRTTNKFCSEKLTWAFSSGELKTGLMDWQTDGQV